MESILEQIERGKLWPIPGGVHPETKKMRSTQKPIARLSLPEILTIPLKQHIGDNGRLLVEIGDTVLKGQPLTEPAGHWSVPIHAPTSGTITEIGMKPSTHPSALPEPAIELQPDGCDKWCELFPWPDFYAKTDAEIIDRIHTAGISGMGGAGFPAYVKAQPYNPIELLIINGVECEPYISSDDMLMREHAAELIKGIEVLRKLYQPTKILIGVEDDKPQAIKALKKACEEDHNTQVCAVPTKYPSGGEKQLIQILTSKEVPQGGIPADIGMVVHNVGTIFSIYQAIFEGKPLIERVVTVTGETVKQPQNIWALLGTPIKFLLEQCQFEPEQWQRVIMGGPMMGFTLPSVRMPIVKTSNCVLAPSQQEMPMAGEEKACIRCSACADACPAVLLPQQLQWFAKSKEYEKLEEHNLFDCIECGACAYVCPSEIPLVQYYRVAKAEIRQQRDDKVNAERAKKRFELRNERLKRDQEERSKRHTRTAKRPTSAVKSQVDDAKRVEDADKKAAVAAALARAKAKRTVADEPDNSEMASLRAARKAQARAYKDDKVTEAADKQPNKQDAVAAAIARAKAKKAKQAEAGSQSKNEGAPVETNDDARKAAVAAAIARAKAKKAQQASNVQQDEVEPTSESTVEQTNDDPRKAAVAAAIARAKAKKAQQESNAQQAEVEPNSESTVEQANDDPRKAAVAAAIARAKAKKAKQAEAVSLSKNEDAPVETNDDPRKAAVAAAIARAKAKKAQQASNVQQEEVESTSESTVEQTNDDPRKAAVAAAIARAKAKKLKQQKEET